MRRAAQSPPPVRHQRPRPTLPRSARPLVLETRRLVMVTRRQNGDRETLRISRTLRQSVRSLAREQRRQPTETRRLSRDRRLGLIAGRLRSRMVTRQRTTRRLTRSHRVLRSLTPWMSPPLRVRQNPIRQLVRRPILPSRVPRSLPQRLMSPRQPRLLRDSQPRGVHPSPPPGLRNPTSQPQTAPRARQPWRAPRSSSRIPPFPPRT